MTDRPIEPFPNAEALVSRYIREYLDMPRVYSSIPKHPEWPLLVVFRVSGRAMNKRRWDRPNIQIEAWGKNETKTAVWDLAIGARTAVFDMEGKTFYREDGWPDDAFISDVDDSMPMQWIPDETADRDRYIFSMAVTLRKDEPPTSE